jgi:hypothetical protein
VLFGIIPHAIDFGEAKHRLIAMNAVEHEHGEIAGAHGDGSTAKRRAASAAGLRCEFCRLLRLQLNGRDFAELITLVPGVSNQNLEDQGIAK